MAGVWRGELGRARTRCAREEGGEFSSFSFSHAFLPRLRAVVFLFLEPSAVSGKVKLCKLMVKRRGDWGFRPHSSRLHSLSSHALLSIYCDAKAKCETARSVLSVQLDPLISTSLSLQVASKPTLLASSILNVYISCRNFATCATKRRHSPFCPCANESRCCIGKSVIFLAFLKTIIYGAVIK